MFSFYLIWLYTSKNPVNIANQTSNTILIEDFILPPSLIHTNSISYFIGVGLILLVSYLYMVLLGPLWVRCAYDFLKIQIFQIEDLSCFEDTLFTIVFVLYLVFLPIFTTIVFIV